MGWGLARARLPQLPFIEPALGFLPLVDFAFALAPLVDAGTEDSLEPVGFLTLPSAGRVTCRGEDTTVKCRPPSPPPEEGGRYVHKHYT